MPLKKKEGGKSLKEIIGGPPDMRNDPTCKRHDNGIRLTPGNWEELNLTPRPRGRRRTIVIIEE